MKTLRAFFLCALPAIFACGCPFNNDPCANVTCEDDEVCENGECVAAPCDSDADCEQGFCSEAEGQCVECLQDSQCDDDDACTDDSCSSANCVNADIDCETTADCPAGCNATCTEGVCGAGN